MAAMQSTQRSRKTSDADTSTLSTSHSTTSRTSNSGSSASRPVQSVRFRSEEDIHVVQRVQDADLSGKPRPIPQQHTATTTPRIYNLQSQSPLPVGNQSMMYRLGAIVFLLVAVVPLLHSTSFFGHASMPLQPVSGRAVPEHADGIILDRRQSDSPTAVCRRWAQMSAIVNGTLYLYGGQATETETQDSNRWNNNFLSLDLTDSEYTVSKL